MVSVTTVYPGAAPEVVETSVTDPIEDQVNGIEGVKRLTSLSREQVSLITVEFELGRNLDEAANDVRDRVARARRDLPEEVEDPVVAKQDSDAQPVFWMALFGRGFDQVELTTIADNELVDRLAKLPGVASVVIAVSSAHRADAFAAARFTIDRLKEVVPIWKKEFFSGGAVWIGDQACRDGVWQQAEQVGDGIRERREDSPQSGAKTG